MKSAAWEGAVMGGAFGLGPELPSGWLGFLAGGLLGANAAALKAMTLDEAWFYLVEAKSKDSEFNVDAQIEKQCSKLENPKP